MKYLFNEWDKLKNKIKGRRLFIFLDFDGTLAPIAQTPAKAVIPGETKILLNRLSRRTGVKVAIISGRSLKDVKRKLGLHNIIYSGNHGLEIDGPRVEFSPLVSRGYGIALKALKNTLAKKLYPVKGIILEDKGISLSLHYRLVSDGQIPPVKKIFREAVKPYLKAGRVKLSSGKKVWELRPPLEWDKGKVVAWLFRSQKLARGKNKALPVYIGDDLTDEDAFKALKHKGISILVGSPLRSSGADFYVRNTSEVARLLKNILEI
jgi:trehalose-phosphatase